MNCTIWAICCFTSQLVHSPTPKKVEVMQDSEVKQQIAQMVQFINQEAQEKAQEIKLKADEEFNIEKLRMVEGEKQKIRAEYEKKEKNVEVQKRIAQSNEVRLARLKALKTRDDAMQAVLSEAAAKLPSLTQGSGYQTLLQGLILEALIAVQEPVMQVKGVAGQGAVAQKALAAATPQYKEWATKNKNAEFAAAVNVTFDPAGLTSGIGGVQVAGFGGKITLDNTLQSRLMLG